MLDWLIVGGGIHGTYISNFLLKFGFASEGKLRVIDPYANPVQQWKERTSRVSMKFLRSPGEHHLDVGSRALIRYARSMKGGGAELYSDYQRPSLRVFNSHCDAVVGSNNLTSIRYQAAAKEVVRSKDGYLLTSDDGLQFETKRLIFSLGCTEFSIPAWAQGLASGDAPVCHVFSPRFPVFRAGEFKKAVVVGNGISAVQLALGLANDTGKTVTLVHSRPIRTYQFDADPCWILDGKCLPELSRQSDYAKRRNIVNNGRHWNSVPEDIKRQLASAMKNGKLICLENSVASASYLDGKLSLELSGGARIDSDFVVLATGFSRNVPGGDFVRDAIKNLDLDCAPCGFPRVDKYLQWSENLFVSGPLADLEVGPASRNIVGARLAAEKITKSIAKPRTILREEHYYYFAKRRNH